MMNEARTSDYHFKDFRPEMKLFPDLIPFVGLITVAERERRRENESAKSFYLLDFLKMTKKDVLMLGVANWSESTSREAFIRSLVLAGRNVLFPSYHLLFVPIAAIEVARSLSSLIGK
ncbi:MAG: hypothetical protein WCV81_00500 [Microgenomates group bacterium]|jgi:hypothetical protein